MQCWNKEKQKRVRTRKAGVCHAVLEQRKAGESADKESRGLSCSAGTKKSRGECRQGKQGSVMQCWNKEKQGRVRTRKVGVCHAVLEQRKAEESADKESRGLSCSAGTKKRGGKCGQGKQESVMQCWNKEKQGRVRTRKVGVCHAVLEQRKAEESADKESRGLSCSTGTKKSRRECGQGKQGSVMQCWNKEKQGRVRTRKAGVCHAVLEQRKEGESADKESRGLSCSTGTKKSRGESRQGKQGSVMQYWNKEKQGRVRTRKAGVCHAVLEQRKAGESADKESRGLSCSAGTKKSRRECGQGKQGSVMQCWNEEKRGKVRTRKAGVCHAVLEQRKAGESADKESRGLSCSTGTKKSRRECGQGKQGSVMQCWNEEKQGRVRTRKVGVCHAVLEQRKAEESADKESRGLSCSTGTKKSRGECGQGKHGSVMQCWNKEKQGRVRTRKVGVCHAVLEQRKAEESADKESRGLSCSAGTKKSRGECGQGK